MPIIQAHGEGGRIITIPSIMGLFSSKDMGTYTVLKFAVVSMMEALRAELADGDIRASVLHPGNMISSAIGRWTRASGPEVHRAGEAWQGNRELNMDPLEMGELVRRGMRRNDMYISTHPEHETIILKRGAALAAAILRDLHPQRARMSMARSG